ncbi:hypothetical protein HOD08_00780 [bacterium]|nr:hypothetical protein [bacterium]
MKRVLFVLFAVTLPFGAIAHLESENLKLAKQIVLSKYLNDIRSEKQLTTLHQLAVATSKLSSSETLGFIYFLFEQPNENLRWLSHLRSEYEVSMHYDGRMIVLQTFFWNVSGNKKLNSISNQNLVRLKQESLQRRKTAKPSDWEHPLQQQSLKRQRSPQQSDWERPLQAEQVHNFFSAENTSPYEEADLNQSFDECIPTCQSPEYPWTNGETEVDDVNEIIEHLRNFTLNPEDQHDKHLAKIARDAFNTNN